MPRIYPSSSFITRAPSRSCIFIPPHAIIQQSIHLHAKHSKTGRETSNQSAPSPSSSLKLKGLAQARRSLAQVSSLHLGESTTSRDSGLCTFSLRRDSPRLGETLARSKLNWSFKRPFA